MASRNSLFFKLSLPVGLCDVALVAFFYILLPTPHPHPQHFLAWQLPNGNFLFLEVPGWVRKFSADTEVFVCLGPRAQPCPQLPCPQPLLSTGFVPMFGLRWSWPGSKKELFLSPCIVLSPIPKMGSGLGGPPNPQLQGRREVGRTWQSLEKGGGQHKTPHTTPPNTHTLAPSLALWPIKTISFWGVLRLFHLLQRKGGGSWDGAGHGEELGGGGTCVDPNLISKRGPGLGKGET